VRTAALTACAAGVRGTAAGNLAGLEQLGPLAYTAAVPALVEVGPVCEELPFRGLLLRSLTARVAWWPAVLMSLLVSGAGHASGVTGPDAGLVARTAVLGAGLAVLARRTGTLTVAVLVHGQGNALSLLLAAHPKRALLA